MKQTDLVLNYLKHNKGITSADAFYKLGIAHLPRRVLDLAERGHEVKKVTEYGVNEHSGEQTHWIRYFISQTPTAFHGASHD